MANTRNPSEIPMFPEAKLAQSLFRLYQAEISQLNKRTNIYLKNRSPSLFQKGSSDLLKTLLFIPQDNDPELLWLFHLSQNEIISKINLILLLREQRLNLKSIHEDEFEKLLYLLNELRLIKKQWQDISDRQCIEDQKKATTPSWFNTLDQKFDKYPSLLKAFTNTGKVLKTSRVDDVSSPSGGLGINISHYGISLLGDLWSLSKALLDNSRIARKTSIGAAVLRIARSVATITLFALSISNPFVSMGLIIVGIGAGLYRDIYIAHQNQNKIDEQELRIKALEKEIKQKSVLDTQFGLKELLPLRQNLLTKEREKLEELKNYRLKNRVRLALDTISVIGGIISIIAIFAFPPLSIFTLAVTGIAITAGAAWLKAYDKGKDDGLSKLISPKLNTQAVINQKLNIVHSKENLKTLHQQPSPSTASPSISTDSGPSSPSTTEDFNDSPINVVNRRFSISQ